ncbi:neuronal acetylcholine receptor subunit alpha-2-like [Argopecten irradians]|uniref:neuronal acetylcholine receptor subunit alpha-2-like n=1 Tax=Argopecten irradians TaxID=31199 RepID=UPI003721F34A
MLRLFNDLRFHRNMIGVVLLCVIATVAVTRIEAASLTDSKALFNNLTSGYNKEMRPIHDQDGVFTLKLDMYLLSIKDFDEVSGTLNVLGAFMVIWKDVSLVWDPSLYGGLNQLYVGQNHIWLPKLYNLKASNQFSAILDPDMTVKIGYDGTVIWSPGGFFDVKCSPDVSYFPFDTQTCSIQLTAWGYTHTVIDLKTQKSEIYINFYETNGEWALDKTSTGTYLLGSYSIATFNITISRLPAFHVVNTLMPIYLLLLMNPLVFVLPCDSGERVGFSLTVFLTFTVFITIINSVLPANSDSMSKLSYFIFIVLVVSGVIATINILQLRMYHKDEDTPVPGWLAKLMRVFDCQCRIRRRMVVVRPVHANKPCLEESLDKKERQSPTEVEATNEMKTTEMTWKNVVHILDTFYTCLFYIIVIVFGITTTTLLYFGDK